MTRMLPMFGRTANDRMSDSCTIDAQFVHLNLVIAKTAKDVFTKPYRVLCDLLHIKERDAKYRLSGERKFSGAELAKLIQTEEGFQFIAAIMADAAKKPQWWRICAPQMEAADARTMQMKAQRQMKKAIEGAIGADRDLSAAIARADSFAVYDPDFYRPHADALRSTLGVPDSAVAPSTTKGRRG